MKHIRIPVTMGHPEAGWFGYVYLWQSQRNGVVGSRLQWFDPRHGGSPDWEETQSHDRLHPMAEESFEDDAHDIIAEHYNLTLAGSTQSKRGRHWYGVSGMRMSA